MNKAWKTLLRENLKKNWLLCVGFLIALLLTSTFPVVRSISYDDSTLVQETVGLILSIGSITYVVIISAFTLLIGIRSFAYMHRVATVTATHMLPVSRKSIFTAKVVAAVVAILIPTLVNVAIIAIIGALIGVKGLFTSVILWVLGSIAIELYVLAMTIIAGTLCGTLVMHFIGAVGLNLIVPVIVLIINFYCNRMLRGYAFAEIWIKIMKWGCPMSNVVSREENMGAGMSLFFIALSIGLICVGYFLFSKRAMEKATDSIAFAGVAPCVVFLLTLIATTLVESYMELFELENVGMVIGFVLSFILSTMLVAKSTKIFNLRTFRNMGISAIIIALIVGSIGLDLFNYNEVNVDAKKLNYAETDLMNQYLNVNLSDVMSGDINRYSGSFFYPDGNEGTRFEDEDNMETVVELCKAYSKIKPKTVEPYYAFGDRNFQFSYSPNRNMYRDFSLISMEEMEKYIKKLYESKEFKTRYTISQINNLDKYKLSYSQTYDDEALINKSDMSKLIAAMDKDFKLRTYEEEKITSKTYAGYISFSYGKGDNNEKNMSIPIRTSDKNTLELLESKGYMENLPFATDKIDSVGITRIDSKEGEEDKYYFADVDNNLYEDMSVRDFMKKYDGQMNGTSYASKYQVLISLKMPASAVAEGYTDSYSICYSEKDAPDFVKNASYKLEGTD